MMTLGLFDLFWVFLIPLFFMIVLLSTTLFQSKKDFKHSGLGLGIIILIGAFIGLVMVYTNLLAPIVSILLVIYAMILIKTT
ncbi:MAG: hypothetical protein ACLFRI_07805 [Candidatus Izemoplasmataceae bacterium]